MKQKYLEKEWQKMLKTESTWLKRNLHAEHAGWQEKIGKHVPEKLQSALNQAFLKAFQMIFEKGTPVIEKTCNKEKREQDYKIQEFAAEVKGNRRTLKAFGRKAAKSKAVNQAISAVEGVGMGVLGMGLPDIPLFLGVLLKSIYEIALSYGYAYNTEEEQMFILKIIETALLHEDALLDGNVELNDWISGVRAENTDMEEMMSCAAKALSDELLYLKFVQGIPVVGIAGGISDMVYQRKITDYASVKYQRRFLEDRK